MTCKFYPLVLSGFFLANAAFATTPPILDKDGPVCSSMLCAFKSPGGVYINGTGYYVHATQRNGTRFSD